MTTYCLLDNNGRVVGEIESKESLSEIDYEYVDGTRVVRVIPKDNMPSDALQRPLRPPQEPSGCMGYEEGPPMDKILSEGSETLPSLVHDVSGSED
jgi:hypothetical protein